MALNSAESQQTPAEAIFPALSRRQREQRAFRLHIELSSEPTEIHARSQQVEGMRRYIPSESKRKKEEGRGHKI